MSNISDYQALVAAMTVSFTSQSGESIALTADNATDLKNAYKAADVPVRILLPYGGGENLSAEILDPDESFGPNFHIRWTFSDVLLWRHLALGKGLSDSAYDLREYLASYAVAAEALEQTGITDRMTKKSVSMQAVENYIFGGEYFIGAVATWTVTEDDPPEG